MSDTRRGFTSAEKVSILRHNLLERVPVSNLCDEFGLNPNVFYRWQKEFFDNGAAVFEARGDSKTQRLDRETATVWARLAHKEEVSFHVADSSVPGADFPTMQAGKTRTSQQRAFSVRGPAVSEETASVGS